MIDKQRNSKVGQGVAKSKNTAGRTKIPFQPTASDLRRLERSSASIMKVLQRRTEDSLEVGRLLTAAKADLDHGFFLSWIDKELPFGPRMGQTYMRIYAVLAEHADALGGFQVNTLDALGAKAVSEEHRNTVVSEMRSGELASDEAVLERLRHLVAPDRADKAVRVKAEQAAARKKVALLTYTLVGDRVSEIIELLRAAGLSGLADTLEEVVTAPDVPPGSTANASTTPTSSEELDDDADPVDGLAIETVEPLPDFLRPF